MVGVSQTGFGGYAEQTQPGEALPRVGYELGGSIVPGVAGTLLIDRIGAIKDALVNMFGRAKAEGRKDLFEIRRKRFKRRLQAVGRIKKILEDNGDDVEALIKELSEIQCTNQKYERSSVQLIKLTAGQKSGNPVLMAIEASLASSSQGLGKTRKENQYLQTKH